MWECWRIIHLFQKWSWEQRVPTSHYISIFCFGFDHYDVHVRDSCPCYEKERLILVLRTFR
jgi:hypothetical protein